MAGLHYGIAGFNAGKVGVLFEEFAALLIGLGFDVVILDGRLEQHPRMHSNFHKRVRVGCPPTVNVDEALNRKFLGCQSDLSLSNIMRLPSARIIRCHRLPVGKRRTCRQASAPRTGNETRTERSLLTKQCAVKAEFGGCNFRPGTEARR